MRLFSYVVARDYGFAPNPFYGVCTLATCKPGIRRSAKVGDCVVGTGSATYGLTGRMVFAFIVSEKLTFDQYWSDARFSNKCPNLRGSLKQAFGDNIYHRNSKSGLWFQADSHHSFRDGKPNQKNIDHDTQVTEMLVGDDFVYWGGSGPTIPRRFRNFRGTDICKNGPGYKCHFPDELVIRFLQWLRAQKPWGYRGDPAEF